MKLILAVFAILLFLLATFVFITYHGVLKNPKNTATTQKITATMPPIKMTTGTVTIRGHAFSVETVRSTHDQEIGLSGRDSLPSTHGMLFLFSSPSDLRFWMKNMKFPLDIIFINGNTINTIRQNLAPVSSSEQNPPIYMPVKVSDKVLEINANLSQKYGFQVGDNVSIQP